MIVTLNDPTVAPVTVGAMIKPPACADIVEAGGASTEEEMEAVVVVLSVVEQKKPDMVKQ